MKNKGNQIIIKGNQNSLSGQIQQSLKPSHSKENIKAEYDRSMTKTLKSLVKNNKITDALNMLDNLSLNQESSALCVRTLARLRKLEFDRLEGTITQGEYKKEYNFIIKATLHLIENVEDLV